MTFSDIITLVFLSLTTTVIIGSIIRYIHIELDYRQLHRESDKKFRIKE